MHLRTLLQVIVVTVRMGAMQRPGARAAVEAVAEVPRKLAGVGIHGKTLVDVVKVEILQVVEETAQAVVEREGQGRESSGRTWGMMLSCFVK